VRHVDSLSIIDPASLNIVRVARALDRMSSVPIDIGASAGDKLADTSATGLAGATEVDVAALSLPAKGTGDAETDGLDLLAQYGLSAVLTDMRARKLKPTFQHYLSNVPTDVVPIRPRCRAGSLMVIAMQPVNEDERVLEEFDARVLRGALTLHEGSERPALPAWLDEEQPADEDERKKRRERRKKKKKRKEKGGKRKREGEGGEDEGGGVGGREDVLDEDERRLKKKRRRRRESEEPGGVRAS
jgi:hypothetical protein